MLVKVHKTLARWLAAAALERLGSLAASEHPGSEAMNHDLKQKGHLRNHTIGIYFMGYMFQLWNNLTVFFRLDWS